ncbi:hypothetical protein [Spiroplasma endosymbiont of Nebria brevicollis]|uniref:hypothetical protein n=1 Tax=Spiroplasma endosymbiont of Nebria brevicollis TaxID=3066284 RepID=UPI00313A7BCB
MKPKKQNDYLNNNYQKPNKLKDCKVEKYKIDNDLKVLQSHKLWWWPSTQNI